MPAIHFEQFLAEAVVADREPGLGLRRDELYGLYTSWCLLHQAELQPPAALWDALHNAGINPDSNNLSMTGPAAADYIVASAPDLV
ncbi:hypothetical protein [Pseudarthrobacter niigatensis]|uniref:DNA primase/nucleoside triphosphatase C-terminal domain-containing protein n=1 Tax=Pseudarthrobacter niigatensis TaxID=369935 RepID=A0AAJ1SV73_9MICC|nr:hypothetical protein [Pseudarthrobacter niigatensis]MDQ0147965.1 hypothetical protein [Pseudarthrobacter niigatensis]MDQ0268049.1 hypothetical protein [Pseudarthrobacter niigatensis]